MVDDFRVKYIGKKHAEHLLKAIQGHYKVSTDWEEQQYCSISIKWNYQQQVVDLSIPGYTQAALHIFQHRPLSRKEHAPYSWERPNHGATQKFAEAEDISQPPPPQSVY